MKNYKGFTFIELLISIAIISIMSAVFWISIRQDYRAVVRRETEKVAADFRQTRALATSRAIDRTTGLYPEGGYGIQFYNSPARYIVYADNDDSNNFGYQAGVDNIIKQVSLDSEITELQDLYSTLTSFHFRFRTENNIQTNLWPSPADHYAIALQGTDYYGVIRLGEETEDGFVWSNIAIVYYEEDPENPGSPGGKGFIEMESN